MALRLLRSRQAIAVTHLAGHWHHIRHACDAVPVVICAFNLLEDQSPWEEKLSLQSATAGDSKEDELDLLSSDED